MRHIKRFKEEYYFGEVGDKMKVGCIFKIKNLIIDRIFSSEYLLTGEEMILEVVGFWGSGTFKGKSFVKEDVIQVKILLSKGEDGWIEKNLSGNIRLWNYPVGLRIYISLSPEEREVVDIFKSRSKFGI